MEYLPSLKRIEQSVGDYMDKAAANVMITEENDPARLFFLRPSSFPYCGLQFFLDFPRRLNDPRIATLASSYFTEVGTATHSVFQRYTGRLGKIVGDWRCPKCKKVRKFKTYKVCKCGGEPHYDEIELVYKKTVVGHTDALFRFSPAEEEKSSHAVLDYKTTSKKKIDEDKSQAEKKLKRVFPYRYNVAQIEMYVPLLEAQYGIPVDYWMLIYLARDAPFQYGRQIITKALTKEDKEKLKAKLDKTVKIHRKVLVAKTKDDTELIKKYKLCKSLEDYKKNWRDENNECPFLNVCFKKKELDTLLGKHVKMKVYPIVEQAPKRIRETLGL